MSNSELEETLLWQIKVLDLPLPIREYRFCKGRRWQADFAWPAMKLLVEVEGGIYRNGRHVRPVGFAKDCDKYNTATLMGYRVLRFTPAMVKDGRAVNMIEGVLHGSTNKD